MIVKVKRTTGDNPGAKRFVNNDELLAEIIACKAAGNVMSKRLGELLYLMCERYSFKTNFNRYDTREDMVQDAMLNLCKNWSKFDETKFRNPFAYFTTAIHRSFLQGIHEEKYQREIKEAICLDKGISYGFGTQGEEETTLD